MSMQSVCSMSILVRTIRHASLPVQTKGTRPALWSYCHKQNYSRYSANTIMAKNEVFRFKDYNIIGFDLDNTLLRYNLPEMAQLEYETLANYLISNGYSSKYLSKPITDDMDYLQRGLFLDTERGNTLQMAADGVIVKAAHGTKFLTEKEIIDIYGKKKKWSALNQFIKDPLSTWNGPMSNQIRALLDYFDMPASLVFARAVDTIDESGKPPKKYTVWDDLLAALVHMYSRENYANDKSKYFAEMKRNPSKYILKTSQKTIAWIEEMRKDKAIFLLSGSNSDFANLTATEAFGSNWQELFDVVVCFSKKPGFFTLNRPFHRVINHEEVGEVSANELKLGEVYTQGNWNGLEQFLCEKKNFVIPRSLYIGDNFIQDIYTPSQHTNCDTVTIAEEMLGEGMIATDLSHEYKNVIVSGSWGSYFGTLNQPSIWTTIAQKHSRICAPSLDFLADKSITEEYECFSDTAPVTGFFPAPPKSLY